jgi:hypothetical protein
MFVGSHVERHDCDAHSEHKINHIYRKERSGYDAPGREHTEMQTKETSF